MGSIERIFELMKEKNVTSAMLTKKIPLQNGSIAQWKQGKKEPSNEEIKKIARYFCVSVEYLTEEDFAEEELDSKKAMNDNPLNQRLKNILHKKEISFEHLCTVLHIPISTFYRWIECGEEIPLRYLLPICQFLDINLSCLLIQEEELTPAKKKRNTFKFTQRNRLKFLREKYRVDAETLASYIMDTAQNVIMYENNIKKPSHGKIQKIAKFYKVSEKYLLGESNMMQDDNMSNKDSIILTIEKNEKKDTIEISEEEKQKIYEILSLKNRLCFIRKKLNLTQEEFGDKFNLKKDMVEKYEKGICYPSEQIIKAICFCFNVNKTWLCTGEGGEENMFCSTEEYEFYKNIEKLLQLDDKFIKNAINILINTDSKNLEIIGTFMKSFFGNFTEENTKKRL